MKGETEIFLNFEDLEVYKLAREFRKKMYGVARRLPDFEKFGLANQIRRAAVSLTNNIAEGHGSFHFLDQVKFMLNSRGSLEELLDDLNTCEDEAYLPSSEIAELREHGWLTHKVLNGYIRYLRNRQANCTDRVKEESNYEELSLPDDDLGTPTLTHRTALTL